MKLCVALDLDKREENLKIIKNIKDFDVWLKVGLRSYIRDGQDFLKEIKQINPNFKIFLDLKLYDIPNTTADAAFEVAQLGVDMFNIHASAGKEAMHAVMKRLQDMDNRPKVLAVTALTSFDEVGFRDVYNQDLTQTAIKFAKDTYACGLDGVVSSVYESKAIKNATSNEFITLTPGIRPFSEDSGDQKRVADINMAKENLVDFIVVGRPIYKSDDPKGVVERILENI
ncbi:orotidine-5'-phosphate decarboxylase [Arcobacter sp. FWKO B]|uniref:orotidine-5'-phosphate decarboxylase n=1 Tax=Arcobacter sp. FWKO B TaxID=2593672 RepID=UPI0018A5D841|nr:orotidine-5'-phosphate decarboxylase [Arcobacter sp. FWKO B]QOG11196.1 orotidine-5'-phosphate decarboxylase [Arcobacter sp. FWKO B]